MKKIACLLAVLALAACTTVPPPRNPSCLALAQMAATTYSQPPMVGGQIDPTGQQYETRILSGTLDGEPHAIAQALIDGEWRYLYWCARTGSVWAETDPPEGWVEN